MKITWLGHSAFRIDFSGAVLMIDPFLSGSPTFNGDVGEVSRGCTHIALTHGHDDHIGDTVDIARATGATLIACFEICNHLAAKGVEKYEPGNTGGTIDLGAFTVTFVQALHSSASLADGPITYLGNPLGLVIKADGHTIYDMADTDIFSDMALIDEIHQPDIGFVPIGDRFTMGGDVAALACKKYFEFRTVVPIHYGTFPIIDQTADKFVAAMKPAKVTVPEIGVGFEV
jgi:L-ascorbate metabolism protein UlaG (beta-lactamase superfamily)